MRAALLALSFFAAASSAAGQAVSPAERLARWTEHTSLRALAPVREGRPMAEVAPPDPHELDCRTQAPSCACGGYPSPGPTRGEQGRLQRRLQTCLETGLRRDPYLAGRIEVELEVRSGRVTEVRIVENTVTDAAIGQCLAHAYLGVQLPAVTGRATMRHSVTLGPPPER